MNRYPRRIDMMRKLGGVGAEIGVYQGDFSAELLTIPRLTKLHLIDCWCHQPDPAYIPDTANVDDGGHEHNYQTVLKRFHRELRSGLVEVHRGFSEKIVQQFADDSLDWVYIDANHTYEAVLRDLSLWGRKARVICGHDYCLNDRATSMGFGVVDAVVDFCLDAGWQLTALTDEEWASYRLDRLA